jgi:antirestriction protein ArdC
MGAARSGNVPQNAVTKRLYSGANVVFLWAHGYAVLALDAGGTVRKGEHGTRVYFVSKLEKPSDDGDKPNLIPFLKEYVVFNIAQCHGLPDEYLIGEAKPINLDQRDVEAQEFIKVTGADFISMPHFDAFKDSDSFDATSFHELGHWTAHKSRLDRDLKNRFGSRDYAAEELVAELASALCGIRN